MDSETVTSYYLCPKHMRKHLTPVSTIKQEGSTESCKEVTMDDALTKYRMYDFHYNTWMKKLPNSTLLFTDTDSLAYEVVGHDLYAGMAETKDKFDFSEYPKNHFLQSYDNMRVVGKFNDECKQQMMLRFVGLHPKLYSFDYEQEAHFDCKDGVEEEAKVY